DTAKHAEKREGASLGKTIQRPNNGLANPKHSQPNQQARKTVEDVDARKVDEMGPAKIKQRNCSSPEAHQPCGQKVWRDRQTKEAGRHGETFYFIQFYESEGQDRKKLAHNHAAERAKRKEKC